MRAWGRVREIEIKKDEVEEKIHSKKATGGDTNNMDSDEEVGCSQVLRCLYHVLFQLNEAEMEEFLNWRQKKT